MKLKHSKKKTIIKPAVIVKVAPPTEVDGEYRMSAGSTLKITKKIGDAYVGVETTFNTTVPADKDNMKRCEEQLVEYVQCAVVAALTKQISRVMSEMEIE